MFGKVAIAIAALTAIFLVALLAEPMRRAVVAWLVKPRAVRKPAGGGQAAPDRFGRDGRGKVVPMRSGPAAGSRVQGQAARR